MALKDWKTLGKDAWHKSGYGGIIFVDKNSKGWYFEHGQREYFKTKLQALKFAKEYMKKH